MAEFTARQLALVEGQRLFRVQNVDRVQKEMRAIDEIRAKRLAAKASRVRFNLISAAVCVSCCASGFLVAFSLTHKNSPSISNIEIRAKSAQWTGKVVGSSAPNPASIDVASAPATQISKAAPTTIAAPIQGVKVVSRLLQPAQAPGNATIQSQSPIALRAQTQPVTRPTAQPVIRFTAQTRTNGVQPKAQNVVLPSNVVSATVTNSEKPKDDGEVVLPFRVVQKELAEQKFQGKEPTSSPGDFKVVNAVEGALIVRLGQTVRQVKIGDQLPNGRILKSVDTDNLKFEVEP